MSLLMKIGKLICAVVYSVKLNQNSLSVLNNGFKRSAIHLTY